MAEIWKQICYISNTHFFSAFVYNQHEGPYTKGRMAAKQIACLSLRLNCYVHKAGRCATNSILSPQENGLLKYRPRIHWGYMHRLPLSLHGDKATKKKLSLLPSPGLDWKYSQGRSLGSVRKNIKCSTHLSHLCSRADFSLGSFWK